MAWFILPGDQPYVMQDLARVSSVWTCIDDLDDHDLEVDAENLYPTLITI